MELETAEQLVEVPTVVSFSSLQRTAEQSIDIPGTSRRRGGGGGLQGLHPGHSSSASAGEQIADIPVPRGRGGLGVGSLQGFSPGQGATAFDGADHVDIPVPRSEGLQCFHPGQSSRASSLSSRTAEEALDGVFRTFPGVEKSAGSASQCGDHPPGYFPPSGVVAHSSPWSPAACGHGTLPGEDDEEEEEELEMFDESIDRFELCGLRPDASAVTTWQAAVPAGGAARLRMASKSFTRHPFQITSGEEAGEVEAKVAAVGVQSCSKRSSLARQEYAGAALKTGGTQAFAVRRWGGGFSAPG